MTDLVNVRVEQRVNSAGESAEYLMFDVVTDRPQPPVAHPVYGFLLERQASDGNYTLSIHPSYIDALKADKLPYSA